MELINFTRMAAGFNMGLEPSGRELLVVIVKGSFRLPPPGAPTGHCVLHDTQVPLVMADSFTGEPGLSAPVYEIDFAPRKRQCDVLLLGQAHAPQGRPATRIEVGMHIGPWRKRLAVVGSRRWDCAHAKPRATPPEAFVTQPITYDVAYGGTDLQHEDPARHAAYMANPVGMGFHKHLNKAWVDGKPLPRTEEIGRTVTDPDGDYRPMAYGPVGRGWEPRARYAGTYDEAWRDDHFPFLPPDFDDQYFQAAPANQQVPLALFMEGPQQVTLTNLTPQGSTQFTIPHLRAPVQVFPKRGGREDFTASLDTVVIEPELQRFTLSWRVTRPLQRGLFDIAQVLVGRNGPVDVALASA